MANGQLKSKDVYQADLYADLVKSAEQANKILLEQETRLKELQKLFNKLGLKSVEGVKKLANAEKEARLVTEAKIKTERARIMLLNEKSKLEKTQTASLKEEIKLKVESTKQTKAEEAAKQASLKTSQEELKVRQQNSKATLEELKAQQQLSRAAAEEQKANQATLKTSQEKLKQEQQIIRNLSEQEKLKQQQLRTSKLEQQEQERVNKAKEKAKKIILDQSNAYKKLTSDTNKAQAEFKRLAAQYGVTDKRSQAALKSFTNLDDRLRRVNEAARDGRRDVGRYHLAMGNLSATISKGLGLLGITAGAAALRKVISSSIGVFSSFEKSLSNLEAVSQATNEQMASLSVEARRLGATTAFTATEVVGLQTEFAKLGFPVDDIQQMTKSTLDAAAAMGSGLAETAALTGATLKGFGLEADQAARVNDVLTKSTQASALDFSKLNTALSQVAPVAKSFGFSIENTTSLLGQLANAGFDASTAATSTRNILLNLADSNGELAKSLKEPVTDLPSLIKGLKQLKSEGIDLGTALELTDKRSVAAFNTFLDGTDSVLTLNDALEKAGGTAERAAKTQLDNLQGSVTKLGSAWEGFILSIEKGDGAISRALRSIVDFTASILGAISGTTDLSTAYFEQSSAVNNLESSLTPLLSRYDELSEKTTLSTTEQEELDTIINQVAEDVPSAVTAFDKYGKALGLSTDAARNFIKEQKSILAVKNKEAIEEQQDAIDDLTFKLSVSSLELRKVNGEYVKTVATFTKGGNAIIKNIALTEEEIASRVKARKEIGEEVKAREAIIAKLRGEQTEAEKALAAEESTSGEKLDIIEKTEEKREGILARIDKQISAKRKEQQETDDEFRIKGLQQEIKDLQEQKKTILDIENDNLERISKLRLESNDKTNKLLIRQTESYLTTLQNIFLDAFKNIEDAQRERLNKQINEYQEFAANVNNIISQISDNQARELDVQINQNSEALSAQEQRAQAGLQNELGFRRKQAAQLEEERERQAKATERRAKVLAYFNLFAENAKQNPDSAAAKSLAQVALAETLVGFFNEGTESIGDDTHTKWRNTGTDDYLAAVHKGERILTADQNKLVGSLSNEELAKLAFQYQNGMLQPNVSATVLDDSRIVNELKGVRQSVGSIKLDVHFNELGDAIISQVNGKIKKVIHEKTGGRFRP